MRPKYLQTKASALPGARGASAEGQYDLRERWSRYEGLVRRATEAAAGPMPAAVVELRWLLEEYAVSVFAQQLKTTLPVSPKRLAQVESAAERAVNALF